MSPKFGTEGAFLENCKYFSEKLFLEYAIKSKFFVALGYENFFSKNCFLKLKTMIEVKIRVYMGFILLRRLVSSSVIYLTLKLWKAFISLSKLLRTMSNCKRIL